MGVRGFKAEADVRRWLEARVSRVWWVENKRGGTFGFPDAIAVGKTALWFLELKLAVRSGAQITIKARPAQMVVLRQLVGAGLNAGILFGIKGEKEVFLSVPDDYVRTSEVAGFGRPQTYKLVPEYLPRWED